MKKSIFLTIFIIAMMLLLTACGSANNISDSATSWMKAMTNAGFHGEIEEDYDVIADLTERLLSSSDLPESDLHELKNAFAGGWYIEADRGVEVICLKMNNEKNADYMYDILRCYFREEEMREYESVNADKCTYSRLNGIFGDESCLLIHSGKTVYAVYADDTDGYVLHHMDSFLENVGFSAQKKS